jgi:uncharacterized protein (DUF433 family)
MSDRWCHPAAMMAVRGRVRHGRLIVDEPTDRVESQDAPMGPNEWRERIVSDADVHGGEPCVRGTRIAVAFLVASLADVQPDEILAEFPQLTRDDIRAALLYAAEAAHNTLVA